MPVVTDIRRGCGHPWDGGTGWDGMHVTANTTTDLDAFIEAAEKKFWQVWINGTIDGKPGAYLYKPHGAMGPWEDTPDKPGPAKNLEFRCRECGYTLKLKERFDDPTTSSGACRCCGGGNWGIWENGVQTS